MIADIKEIEKVIPHRGDMRMVDEIREYFNSSSDLSPIISRLEKMRDELNLTIEKLKERTNKENLYRWASRNGRHHDEG